MILRKNGERIKNYFDGRKAVFFDMDGTVMNTGPLHAKALRKTLEQFGRDCFEMELIKKYHGKGDQDVYLDLNIAGKLDKCSLSEFIVLKNKNLMDIIERLDDTEIEKLITPGVVSLLNDLKKNNYQTALVSASEKKIVNLLLDKSGLTPLFTICKSREDTFMGKPAPSPYLRAMRQLGLSSRDVLIFEDSPTGLLAAEKSGAFVVKVSLNH